jgi:hypothetical protein
MRDSRLVVALSIATLAFAAATAQAQTEAPLTSLEAAVGCASPPSFDGPPDNALHVIGSQDTMPRELFGPRDLLVIDGGTSAGVQLGQRFFVRRLTPVSGSVRQARGTMTLGWLRVVAVNASTAIATVDHICGGISSGDYIEPFVAPVVPAGADRDETPGEPDFTSLGRVVGGNEDRETSARGDFILIDRGSQDGVAPGARFAVYRDIGVAGMPLAAVGEAIVITAGTTMALTRITHARDAVLTGDYVAQRK